MKRSLLAGLAVLVLFAIAAFADEPHAQFQLADSSPHADIPFELVLVVDGFAESPEPQQPRLDIAGATVTPLGVTPHASRSIQIFNGRRSETSTVQWSLRWRVEVHTAGRIKVPETTVSQGSKSATAEGGAVEVESVPVAEDMSIEIGLPARPVFVGETVPVTLTWLFRRQPQDQSFSVPLAASDAFTVSGPPAESVRRAITIPAGSKELQLPFAVDQTAVNGVQTNRLTATFFAAPRRAGKIEIAPATVMAALAVGRPDFFGNAPTRLFRAADVARTLEVRALPETNRPATFSGAVGDQFSIDVRTSRSVVQLGEPVELDVTIRSNQPLDTLSLGALDGEGRLPKDKFTVSADPPTGELSEDRKTKTFRVTAQVTGPATEVPALAFSYFDSTKGAYQTIRSDPIALSVKGGAFVRASDVVAAQRPRTGGPSFAEDTSLVAADLALSSEDAAGDGPLGGAALWLLVGALYAVPVAILAVTTWRIRTRGERDEKAEVRAARRRAEEILASAATLPARDVAGALGTALRDLARVLGREPDDAGLFARIETESFAPAAAARPLSAELREDAARLVERWIGEADRQPSKRVAAAAILLAALGATTASASPADDGRAAYRQAMELTKDATARKAAFARAEIALGEAARAAPDRPELLADWGNAALGAGDVATATLAYRRALAEDGGNARARHNLTWLRSRQPDAFRPAGVGAADTLLFFHAWPRSKRLVVGAAAFALATLLVVPWRGRSRRGFTGPAILPAAVWIAMLGSVVLEDRHADDGVVVDDVVLRAADSSGAPAALSQPLPRGVEVTILDRRDSWTRIRVASGTTGWVPGGSVERISP